MDRCTVRVTLSRQHIILSDNSNTLWCDRSDGRLTAGNELKKDSVLEYVDLGKIWGVVGKICFFTDGDWKLVVVTQASYVGLVPHGGEVYCVDKIGIIPLTSGSGMAAEIIGLELPESLEQSLPGPSGARPNSPTVRGTKIANLALGGPGAADKDKAKEKEKSKEVREREKVEKRLTEALLAMFNDSQSFYFCLDSDLTRSLQRQLDSPRQEHELPLWKRMDEKYFWNKWMLSELLSSDDNDLELSSPWILPLIQGYVEVRQIPVLCEDTPTILQPGWSAHYREEREKLLQESIFEERERRARRGAGSGTGVVMELEMQNMATIDHQGLMIPMCDLGSPGYESGGAASGSEEEDLLTFSPVRFTNKLEDKEKVAGSIREVPAVGSVRESEGEKGGAVESNGGLIGSREGQERGTDQGTAGWEVLAMGRCARENRLEDSRSSDSEEGGGHTGFNGADGGGSQLQESPPQSRTSHGELPHQQSLQAEAGALESPHHQSMQAASESPYHQSIQAGVSESPHQAGVSESPCHQSLQTASESPYHQSTQSPRHQSTQAGVSESPRHQSMQAGCTLTTSHTHNPTIDQNHFTLQDMESVLLDRSKVESHSHPHHSPPNPPPQLGIATAESADNGTGPNQPGTAKSADNGTVTMGPNQPGTAESTDTAMEPSSQSSPVKEQDEDVSSASSGSLFYTSQDVPDLDGVMIDLYESPMEPGGVARQPLSPEVVRSCHTEGLAVHEFPHDLRGASPMGNPFLEEVEAEGEKAEPPSFTLAIISRRSSHRAGTRYKRRGVDTEGDVANYVETELVLQCGSHVVSYVIIRGSVPVYWSQPGNKYRPLPVIERTVDETQEAFKKHFESQLEYFKEMVAVNLVKQTGREKLVGDAFEQHVVLMNSPQLSYVAFDFHQSYKVNQSLALLNLLEGTTEFTKKFKYCWIDAAQSCGALCRQEGVFRVNCMDCLDRTNVVESIISRVVLQLALQKLGMIPFDEKLGGSTLISYQEMWANNGDIISKQYAGTAAMKGDITRYGERKITGLMKDGYNSAHRYYLNVFRDSYRQVLIDLMQGVNPFEAFFSLPRSMQGMDELDDDILPIPERAQSDGSAWSLEREEAMAEMISVCRKELFPNLSDLPFSPALGLTGWVLMEAAGYSFLGDNKEEEPCVVMYSKAKAQLCIVKFNMETKKVICFLRIPTAQIDRIVVGQLGTMIRNTKRLYMRLHYSLIQNTNCYFTFTTAIPISMEEERAILLSIAELLASMQPSISILEQKINKKKSAHHQGIIYLLPPETTQSFPNLSISHMGGQVLRSHDSKSQEVNMSLLNSGEVEEPSLSAPSSPKLKSPMRMKLAHSCEDLLSTVSGSPSHPRTQPSIKVTSASKGEVRRESSVSPELEESNEESDDELEMICLGSVSQPPTNLPVGVTNPLLDVLGSGKETEHDVEEIAETKKNDANETSKFGRLKGRIMKTVKSSNFMSKPISPLPNGGEDCEDAGVSKRTPSPPPPEGNEEGSRVAAVKQRFKMSSPWRKMRRGSSITPSQEEGELSKEEARKNCKSRMIFL